MRAWLLATVAFVLGGAAGSFALGAFDEEPVLRPPCPAGHGLTPDALSCVPDREACRAWFRAKADERVRCTAFSRDGDATLRFALQGRGAAEVRIVDGAGKTVYERTVRFDGGLQQDMVVLGTRGEWTLETRWRDAQGVGEVTLWG